jgi:hypothetical protein
LADASRDPELQYLGESKWQSSGLSNEQAVALGFQILTADETKKLGVNFHRVGSLKLPYFNLKGDQTKFYRTRYLEPLTGFAGAAKKPQKYAQPAGTLNEAYFPPLLPTSWESIAADVNVGIYITEGELKAACACSLGLATIGLGGVDVWRSTRRGIDFLPALKSFQWQNRTVVILFDSDAASNENVVRAQCQLSNALAEKGALPLIGSIPAAKDGTKQGLDDFLVRNGVDALLDLVGEAEPWGEAIALWEMNRDVVYIRDPGFVVDRNTGQRMAPGAFVQHAYANRHYKEIKVIKGKGQTSETKPLAPRWMQWGRRFELQKITYQPGTSQVTSDGKWNSWEGWGCTPRPGDIAPWKWLLGFIFKNAEPGTLEWFEKWCAYPIQYPGAKMFTAAVVWGRAQGTGKTLIAETLGKIYGVNYQLIQNKDLKNKFNEWAQNKQFVYGDEITAGDKRIDADGLKTLITRPEITIDAKFVPTFVVPDCINYYFTSQHADAFFVEDTDRRFLIHEVTGGPADKVFYNTYREWKNGDGPLHLFHHLLTLDLTGFNPTDHAPMTKSKARMIYDSKSDLATWCVHLREDPGAILKVYGDKISKECELFTPTQLFAAYDPNKESRATVNGLSRAMKAAGYEQVNDGVPIACSSGLQRLYAIRNVEKWQKAKPQECRAHYDGFFGTVKERKF